MPIYLQNQSDIFIKSNNSPKVEKNFNAISFKGYSIHIVDGGNDAKNMTHFAKSVDNNWDIYNKEVELNPHNDKIKQLESLEWKLKELNFQSDLSLDKTHNGAYVAIPISANVPLQNLEAQLNAVMGTKIHLTPQNIKTKKQIVLDFLKLLYEEPYKYSDYIKYMDPEHQGIEKTYGIIYQINKLLQKPDTKVYISSGYPEYKSIQWFANQRNRETELTHFIATGQDVDGAVDDIRNTISNNGWYDFNLLTLSDAKIINLGDAQGNSNYIYSAYDSCINDTARGVYNFTPVRDENGILQGYSYHNNNKVEYPYDEFYNNWSIGNIAAIAGRPASELIADGATTEAFKNAVWNNQDRSPYKNKLFRVEDIFPQSERDAGKMWMKGDYVDFTLQSFYRINKDGLVIYPAADCERSGTPSVYPMWDGGFSLFNAIKEDIDLKEKFIEKGYNDENVLNIKHPQKINKLMFESEKFIAEGKTSEAIHLLKYAAELEKIAGLHNYKPLEKLGDVYTSLQDITNAEKYYNLALNELARKIIYKLDGKYSVRDIFTYKNEYENILQKNIDYEHEKDEYDRQGYFQKMFSQEPEKPAGDADKYKEFVDMYDIIVNDAYRLYKKLAENCKVRHQKYPEFACNWAAERMLCPDRIVQELLTRRTENNLYLGDMLNVD